MSNVPSRVSAGRKRILYLGALLVLITSSITPSAPLETSAQTPGAVRPDQHQAMLTTYCFTCHSTRMKSGGLALDSLSLETPAENAQVWEKALRKLRGRLMPPPGNPQPAQKDIDSFVTWMESALDRNAKGPKAGYVPIQRLSRTEYAASVKALVGVDVNEKDVLPQDIQFGGFDNIATVLGMSPAFLDQYITAAQKFAKTAVGSSRVASVTYTVAANREGELQLPPGTRGGIRFKHSFPIDGEYRINILGLGLGSYTRAIENESTLIIMVDGVVVYRKPVGGVTDQTLVDRKGVAKGQEEIISRFSKLPVQVEAGERDVVVAFIDRSHVESDENVATAFTGIGGLGFGAGNERLPILSNGVEIVGPFNPTGPLKIASRALIFICDPMKDGESACARKIAENLARRAYRRPVTRQDVDVLMPFYEIQRAAVGGTFDLGIEQIVMAVLASPEFLYRSIRGVPPAGRSASADTETVLTDLELASRLSYFLWNTGPDDELLALAIAGGLTKPGALDTQVKRMMADPKASSLVTSFAMKWLNIADLEAVRPDPILFKEPIFTDDLRRDFSREAERFLKSILLENRSVVDLLNADYTYLNGRLARHYGVSGVYGLQFRRVTLTNKERWGLLGKGAVLLKTSYGDRTSPVLRGAWVLDKLMGAPPAPPPPNVTTNLDQKVGEKKTVRARLEQHRENKACLQCHGVIDPPGLPLENFDAIGRWRVTDSLADNAVIDARSVLPNGVAVNGPVELREHLASRPAVFAETLTEKLMMYALNRELEYFDMPQARAVVRAAAKDNYSFSSIVLGIVNTEAFRKQGIRDTGSDSRR